MALDLYDWGYRTDDGHDADPFKLGNLVAVIADGSYITGPFSAGAYLTEPGLVVAEKHEAITNGLSLRAPLQPWDTFTAGTYGVAPNPIVPLLSSKVVRPPGRFPQKELVGRDAIVVDGALHNTGLVRPPFLSGIVAAQIVRRIPPPSVRQAISVAPLHTGLARPPFLPGLAAPRVTPFVPAGEVRTPVLVGPFHAGMVRIAFNPMLVQARIVTVVPLATVRKPLVVNRPVFCRDTKRRVDPLRPRLARRNKLPAPRYPIFFRPRLIDWGDRSSEFRGLYRVFGPAEFRFYRSSSAPPAESDTPFATSSTLPAAPSSTFADGRWFLAVSYFNGVYDSGFLALGPNGETWRELVVESSAGVESTPVAPLDVRLELRAGGVVRVVALYAEEGDARADTWSVAYTTDGSTPPADTPSVVEAFAFAGGPVVLVYDLPAQAHGTAVKVRVQARRGSSPYSYSPDSTVVTAVADALGPAAISGDEVWPGSLPEEV